MTLAAAVVLAILVVAFVLFVGGWLGADLVAMLVLVALVFTRTIEPLEAFSGFSSAAVVTIAGLMVIGRGLEQTGVVAIVARRLARVIRERRGRLLFVNTAIPGLLSGFVNIVATASFFIPVILRLCTQMKVPSSKILLPMAAAALIGANLSLIGASHNLVVDSLLEEATGRGFGFFEFTAVGVVLLAVSLLYIVTVGQHLLPGGDEAPHRAEVPVTADLVDVYHLEDRLFEVWVGEGPEGEQELALAGLGLAERGLTPIAIVREEQLHRFPGPEAILRVGDVLLVQGRKKLVEALTEASEMLAFIGSPKSQEKYSLSTGELAEAVIPPRSPAIGHTVEDLALADRYGMTSVAYYREERPYRTGLRDAKLREGDSLLLYGPRDRMREFDPEKELLIYFNPGTPEIATEMRRKAPAAAAVLLAVIVVAALGWFPIAATAVAGAVAMVLLGVVPLERVYEAIDWKTLVLIGGMYPLGIALNATGAGELVGEALIAALGGFGQVAVLAGVVVLAMVLTQPIHNAAVAIIMTPIGIDAAVLVGADPRPFAVGVLVACSTAFLMPYGHPAPLMVEEPGGYGPADYLRFGIGLNVLALGVVLVMVPALWPL